MLCDTGTVQRTRTNIYLSSEQLKRLKAESERTGAPVAELVRRAIDNAYPVEKAKAKQQGS
jgi:predicted DNA-binding protein